MSYVLASKMKKILIILSIFVLNGGLSLYASTYREVIKEANKLGGSGKIIAEIDFRLKMRNLNTMTLDQYALITIQAAWNLQKIGDCKRSLEEVKKLDALDLTRINNDLYEIYHFTQMRQIITLCDSEFKPYLKEYIDNLKWRMPAWMYAESLAYYGKRLVFDQGFYNHEAIFYYSRALGEVLANRRYQYPTIPIHALSKALNYNYQYDLYDTITKPLIAAYDKGTLNRYHPDIFNFVVSHWISISYRGEIEYAKNLEKLIDKGIKEYDAIPAEALIDYVFTKLFLSTYNGKPEIVWNNINNDKRTPEFLKNSAKLGKSDWCVVESDESDGSFLDIPMTYSVVTNIDKEHLDFYKKLEVLQKSFQLFVEKTPSLGKSIICKDDRNNKVLIKKLKINNYLTYGFDKNSNFQINNVRKKLNNSRFNIKLNLVGKIKKNLKNLQIPLLGTII